MAWGFSMIRRVRSVFLLAAIAALCGCGMSAQLRRHTDDAEAQHYGDLRSPGAAAGHFAIPPGLAWNAALAALRRRPGVESADPASWTIRVHPRFESTVSEDGRLATQTATAASIGMTMPAPGTYAFVASFASEARTRAVCSPPSAWQSVAAQTIPGLEEAAAGAIRQRLERFTWPEVAFRPGEGFEAELATALAPYTIASSENDTWTTAWRETVYHGHRVTIRTRSRLSIHRLVAVDGTSRFEVGAELQHQGDREKETSAWTMADASHVGAHGWAALERSAGPIDTTLPEEQPEEILTNATVAPELEAPTDPGRGTYEFVFSLQQRLFRPNRMVTLDLEYAQGAANGTTSWEPWLELPSVPDAGPAVWAPVRQALQGQPFVLQWKAFDKDAPSDAPIATGTIDLYDVVRTCGEVASGTPSGAELRVRAVRPSVQAPGPNAPVPDVQGTTGANPPPPRVYAN